MRKVKFLQDFQGRETHEAFYLKGQEVELEDRIADLLIAEKFAVPVQAEVKMTYEEEMAAPDLEPEVEDRNKLMTDTFGHYVEAAPEIEEASEQMLPAKPRRKRGKK